MANVVFVLFGLATLMVCITSLPSEREIPELTDPPMMAKRGSEESTDPPMIAKRGIEETTEPPMIAKRGSEETTEPPMIAKRGIEETTEPPMIAKRGGGDGIEVYFVVDKVVQNNYRRWGMSTNEMRQEIDYIITETNKYYQTLNLGLTIYKRDLTFLNYDFTNSEDAETVLKSFRTWLERGGKYNSLNYDVAMLFTGKDLIDVKDGRSKTVAGLAQMGTVCNKGAGISELRGGYGAALIVAHELGHLLGANHDNDQNGMIMSPETKLKSSVRWQFSWYTRSQIESNLNAKSCHKSTSYQSSVPNQSLPSRLNTPRKICERTNGGGRTGGAWVCGNKNSGNQGGDGACQVISCATEGSNQCPSEWPYDGMICGKQKTCKKGKCVYDRSANTGNAKDNCPYGDVLKVNINGNNQACSILKTYGLKNNCPNFMETCCELCGGNGGNGGGNGGNGGNGGGNGGNGGNGGCKDSTGRFRIDGATGTCSQLINWTNRVRCASMKTECCASCKRYELYPGCFGDLAPGCSKYTPSQLCTSTQNINSCCKTCRNQRGKRDIAGPHTVELLTPKYIIEEVRSIDE